MLATPSLALLLWTASAGAPVSPCGPGAARDHIRKGHEKSDKGDEAGALTEYQCAFALDASAEAIAQVALAEMALGRWVDAEGHLEQAMSHATDLHRGRSASGSQY